MKWSNPELVTLGGSIQGEETTCEPTGSVPEIIPPPYCANGDADAADCASGVNYDGGGGGDCTSGLDATSCLAGVNGG
jgi:hypothetical protein